MKVKEAQGGIIQPLHVYCPARGTILLLDHHDLMHPHHGLICRELSKCAQLHVPREQLRDLHPVNRDGDRVVVVDHMGDSLAVRLERKLEMRAGHKR